MKKEREEKLRKMKLKLEKEMRERLQQNRIHIEKTYGIILKDITV